MRKMSELSRDGHQDEALVCIVRDQQLMGGKAAKEKAKPPLERGKGEQAILLESEHQM